MKDKNNLFLIVLSVVTVMNAGLCVWLIAQKNSENRAITALNNSIDRYHEKYGSKEADTGVTADTPAALEPSGEGNKEVSENNIKESEEEEFYYEPVSDELKRYMDGKSYRENDRISYDDLAHVVVKYIDFDWNVREGELIVNKKIAQDVVDIFKELYNEKYQIEKIRLVDEYNGDDDASMADNNTSAFNYRVIDGTDEISDHGYGLAIDINPLYNPYVRTDFGDRNVLPVNGAQYADRSKEFEHKIVKEDVCYNAFKKRGFLWGGEWDSPVDYQHFYKEPED